MEQKDQSTRNTAAAVLKIGSWLSAAGAILVPVALLSLELPRDGLLRLTCSVAWAINGLVWWALLATLAWLSEEVRDLHHHLSKALK